MVSDFVFAPITLPLSTRILITSLPSYIFTPPLFAPLIKPIKIACGSSNLSSGEKLPPRRSFDLKKGQRLAISI